MGSFLLCACGCGGALHPVAARTLWPAQRVSGPTIEPLTLGEAKLHCKVEHDADDALLASLISSARAHTENYCERVIGAQTWRVIVDGAPSAWPIPLRRGPVRTLDSVTLVAPGIETPVTDCVLDLATTPALLYPPLAGWPPPTGAPWLRTRVEYGAGAEDTPEPIRQFMLLLVGQWYDSRATVRLGSIATPMPFAEALLAPYRTTSGVIAGP